MSTATIGRNDACPCGSPRKAKKCHTDYIGMVLAEAAYVVEMQVFLEAQPGYVPPLSDEERRNWKETGCPHSLCSYGNDVGEACAAGCGA